MLYPTGRSISVADWRVLALMALLPMVSVGCGSGLPPTGSSVAENPVRARARDAAYAQLYDAQGKPKNLASPRRSPATIPVVPGSRR